MNNDLFKIEAIKLKNNLNNESKFTINNILKDYKNVVNELKNYITIEIFGNIKRDINDFFNKNYNITTIFRIEDFQNDLEDFMEKLENKFNFDDKLEEYENDEVFKKVFSNYEKYIEEKIEEESSKNRKVKIDKKIVEWLKENLELNDIKELDFNSLSIGKKMNEVEKLIDSDSNWDKIRAVKKILSIIFNLKNEVLSAFEDINNLLKQKFENINKKIDIFITCC